MRPGSSLLIRPVFCSSMVATAPLRVMASASFPRASLFHLRSERLGTS